MVGGVHGGVRGIRVGEIQFIGGVGENQTDKKCIYKTFNHNLLATQRVDAACPGILSNNYGNSGQFDLDLLF